MSEVFGQWNSYDIKLMLSRRDDSNGTWRQQIGLATTRSSQLTNLLKPIYIQQFPVSSEVFKIQNNW